MIIRNVLSLIVLLLATSCTGSGPATTSFVIVNARVVDGSGEPLQRVNVRVVADRIDRVGNIVPGSTDTVIDAQGLVLAPGFIDTHSHHAHQLDEFPGALGAVSQGITTIVAGQDGGHLFPLQDFFTGLEESPVAVNVASYAGHGTIRGLVMSDDYRRHASEDEVARMSDILRNEMRAGAIGLSTGLEYDPGSFSSREEVLELAGVAAEVGGHYLSHIRSEDQFLWDAIDEAIEIGLKNQMPVRVTHIKLAMQRWWGQTDRLLAVLDEARTSGVDLTVDVYPYEAWNSSFSWLETLFPERDLDRRDGAEYVVNDMLSAEGIFISAYHPNPAYDGMTLAEIADVRGQDPETALMELLKAERASDLPPSPMLGFAMQEEDIATIMTWPYTVIGSDGELRGAHPRGYGTFSRYLGHFVRDLNVQNLEEGVRRITSMPAEQVGIAQRGMIKKGYYADLVLFDPETIIDRATPAEPHLTSLGINSVWVNGELVYTGAAETGARPGMPVRRLAD